jgi:phosphonoacetaldehyde hydrolase
MAELKAVVFDWAGTMVDFGSCAPMGVFVEAFRRFNVAIDIAEARGPMGLPKRAHIKALLEMPRISAAWAARHGHAPGDADIGALYDVFLPLNEAIAADYADLIPGALETVHALRARGLKIGSTTGYTRSIMAHVTPVAAKQGYAPDNLVCAGDLADGRPSPLMMYRTFADLGVWPPSRVVKVDDTAPGIAEARHAGCWTVGLAASGNGVGLSFADWQALSHSEQRRRVGIAAAPLWQAGCDFVIDTVADLIPVVDEIERRCGLGLSPNP